MAGGQAAKVTSTDSLGSSPNKILAPSIFMEGGAVLKQWIL